MKWFLMFAVIVNVISGALSGMVLIVVDKPLCHNYVFCFTGFAFALVNYKTLKECT